MANVGQTTWLPAWMLERPDFNWTSLQAERASLSAEELQKIKDERLGEEDEIEETDELIADSLESLHEAIDAIEHKEAYETALFVNPSHVECAEFRLAFLRTDRFDVNAAAERIVKYWGRKVELFGPDRAFNSFVSIFDFPEKDYPALIKCGICILRDFDEAGRAIVYENFSNFVDDVDTMMRLVWYNAHIALFDPENGPVVQKLGFVVMTTHGSANRLFPFQSFNDFERYNRCSTEDTTYALPMKAASWHLFLTPVKWVYQILLKLLEKCLAGITSHYRMRLNVFNTLEANENMIVLSDCGISRDCIPIELGGSLILNRQELTYQRTIEDLFVAGVDCVENKNWQEEVPESIVQLLGTLQNSMHM
mmetsp:Transcript_21566/g.30457  ORF Transcript_21566/g.30457 Transcript_21566/m.30457 type:complete len:366 (+) Transcript_21566:51-1148(+)